jgi:hypothetical protein
MQTSSNPHAAAETDAVSLRINLLALNLAIELAQAGDSERESGLPVLALHQLCEFLDDDPHQMGGGEGLRRAVEELERTLRHAGDAADRAAAAGPICAGSEPSVRDQPLRVEGIGGR